MAKKMEKKENYLAKSPKNVCDGVNRKKDNLKPAPETVLEAIRETVDALSRVNTDTLLWAMVDADRVEQRWIADVLEMAFPMAVYEWRRKDESTIDDLEYYIEMWGTKEREADVEGYDVRREAKKITDSAKKVTEVKPVKATKKTTTKKTKKSA